MLEVPASYFVDELKWTRKKSAWLVGALVFLFGIPSALSSVDGSIFHESQMSMRVFGVDENGDPNMANGWFGIIDYWFGTFFIVIVALVTCVYVAWKIPTPQFMAEISEGAPGWHEGSTAMKIFIVFIKFVCPIVIGLVLLNMMGVLGVFAGGG